MLFDFQVVALLKISQIPAARARMWLTPRIIKILPTEACQFFLLTTAWGDPLTMIHGLKLRTICSLGEFPSQGEEGSFHSCILFPSKVYGNVSNKPQNLALMGICRRYPPYVLVSMDSSYSKYLMWCHFFHCLHDAKCQFVSLYKLLSIFSVLGSSVIYPSLF